MHKVFRVQRGDTIVEVLIATAVISLVLVAAYVTANRSYLGMQDTQERGNALKILEAQTESLKAYAAQPGGYTTLLHDADASFCMTVDGSGTIGVATYPLAGGATYPFNGQTNASCILNGDSSVDTSGTEPAYHIQITKLTGVQAGNDYADGTAFRLTATWDSLISSGGDHVQLVYGVYE